MKRTSTVICIVACAISVQTLCADGFSAGVRRIFNIGGNGIESGASAIKKEPLILDPKFTAMRMPRQTLANVETQVLKFQGPVILPPVASATPLASATAAISGASQGLQNLRNIVTHRLPTAIRGRVGAVTRRLEESVLAVKKQYSDNWNNLQAQIRKRWDEKSLHQNRIKDAQNQQLLLPQQKQKVLNAPSNPNTQTANIDKAALIKNNRAKGIEAEAKAAEELIKEGSTILGSQVGVQTKQGLRKVDHLTLNPEKQLIGVEVKAGKGVRTPSQLAKDAEIADKGGKLVGKNAPDALRGSKVKFKTEERRYPE